MHAADLQVAAWLRAAADVEDVRPAVDDRPAGALARRVFPDYPGDGARRARCPRAWLPA